MIEKSLRNKLRNKNKIHIYLNNKFEHQKSTISRFLVFELISDYFRV